MAIDFSGLFHRSSKDRSWQGTVQIPFDESVWPEEWKTLSYKAYPRLEKRELPHPAADGQLYETIDTRTSQRDFSGKGLTAAELSVILRYSCGITNGSVDEHHRAQVSGGTRYPVEVYPLVFSAADGLQNGAYHYAVKNHALDVLWQTTFTKSDIAEMFSYPWALVFTAVFKRNQMKYGERGYRHILIETGAIIQNVYLVATALGLKCCAIDGVNEVRLEKVLDVDGISESVVCSLLLGR